MPVPPLANFALLLGLSFFFGLAFEDFYRRSGERRPGGVRTFPLLAITGGALYLLDTARLLPVVAGLLILGGWLLVYYRDGLRGGCDGRAGGRAHRSRLQHPGLSAGADLARRAPWLGIGVTVTAVLLLARRERLHDLARRVELREIVIAGEFLILTGLVLPLLPDEPVTALTSLTPYKAWLALLAVCTISYASYLLRRYVAPGGGDLWIAALGGLYSSTATTVVLARRAAADRAALPRAEAGIILATALMYPRILAIIAMFNRPLAPALIGLGALGLLLALWRYRRAGAPRGEAPPGTGPRNPLELSAASLFALLFVVISIVWSWVTSRFGETGIVVLAAIVGITDVAPFVLSLAQGVAAPLSAAGAAAAVLIATASNNLLKAGYAAAFAGLRACLPAAGSLLVARSASRSGPSCEADDREEAWREPDCAAAPPRSSAITPIGRRCSRCRSSWSSCSARSSPRASASSSSSRAATPPARTARSSTSPSI